MFDNYCAMETVIINPDKHTQKGKSFDPLCIFLPKSNVDCSGTNVHALTIARPDKSLAHRCRLIKTKINYVGRPEKRKNTSSKIIPTERVIQETFQIFFVIFKRNQEPKRCVMETTRTGNDES